MIGIFYIGEPRFRELTASNHEKLFSNLRENWPITVYDFTWGAWPRDCPSDLAGVVQVWDFYQALSRINQKFIIKLRTDVWFTDSAINAVSNEMSAIYNGTNDLSYIGMELVTDYDKTYARYNAQGIPKVQDFVICANKEGINPTDKQLWEGTNLKKLKSGNRTYRNLMRPDTRAVTVRTQMPLIRKHYDNPNDWQITYDFVAGYHKVESATEYWLNQKPISDS
jgi:hypothetical protein